MINTLRGGIKSTTRSIYFMDIEDFLNFPRDLFAWIVCNVAIWLGLKVDYETDEDEDGYYIAKEDEEILMKAYNEWKKNRKDI